jgi:hypothetical protein
VAVTAFPHGEGGVVGVHEEDPPGGPVPGKLVEEHGDSLVGIEPVPGREQVAGVEAETEPVVVGALEQGRLRDRRRHRTAGPGHQLHEYPHLFGDFDRLAQGASRTMP